MTLHSGRTVRLALSRNVRELFGRFESYVTSNGQEYSRARIPVSDADAIVDACTLVRYELARLIGERLDGTLEVELTAAGLRAQRDVLAGAEYVTVTTRPEAPIVVNPWDEFTGENEESARSDQPTSDAFIRRAADLLAFTLEPYTGAYCRRWHSSDLVASESVVRLVQAGLAEILGTATNGQRVADLTAAGENWRREWEAMESQGTPSARLWAQGMWEREDQEQTGRSRRGTEADDADSTDRKDVQESTSPKAAKPPQRRLRNSRKKG